VSGDASPFQPPPFGEPEFAEGDLEAADLEDELEGDELEDDEDDLEDDELEDDEDDLEDGDIDSGSDGAGHEFDDADLDDDVLTTSSSAPEIGNGLDGGAARAVLEHVARSIVDEPDAVVIDVGEGRTGVKLSLHVAPSDMGRIIGKRGRVAQALRTVVRAAAAGEGSDASVDIVD